MNKLVGTIENVQSSENISIISVDVDGDIFSSIVLEGKKTPLNYRVKDKVTLLFKETEVGLAKGLSGMISLRNRFKATIQKAEKGFRLRGARDQERSRHGRDDEAGENEAVTCARSANVSDLKQSRIILKADDPSAIDGSTKWRVCAAWIVARPDLPAAVE